ncbi:glycine-rich domain-containing protein [Algoriphagus sediminis]|uniref:Ig-like domain-containing protein n=1 Tax=Algoriphagus sediminis TaxID=3057113 RepID=A0ABT7YES9_9BACT|nr:PKD-like domain-containing protein [Algoriphagus sediminis]MDN3204840.1 Ig-like domain-containing protein [Algoriphagus sediminis]
MRNVYPEIFSTLRFRISQSGFGGVFFLFFLVTFFISSSFLSNYANAQCASTTLTYDGTGTFTYVVPAGVTSIDIQVWGAGGAGGGSTDAGRFRGRGGAGGGGGAYVTGTVTVQEGETLTIIVGAGGTGVSGGNGGNGENSSITGSVSGTLAIAVGGNGGAGNTSGGSPAGGAGGNSGSIGGTVTAGQNGGNGETGFGVDSGAGGNGGNGGNGGGSIGGGSSDGNQGSVIGGGGGGSRTSQNGGPYAGGNGARGEVRISFDADPPDSGSISGTQTICSGGDPSILSNSIAGEGSTYQWESSVSPFSSWNEISGATSANYDPPAGLTETTQYRRISITSDGCESNPSNTVQVSIESVNPGSITGTQSVCAGGDPSQIANANAGNGASYRWESSVSPFSSWTTIAGATATSYDPPSGLTETTRYRRVAITASNCEDVTVEVEVTVNPDPTANAGSALAPVCLGDTTPAMGGSVGGSAAGGTWSGGAGSWSNPTDPANATYTPDASETGSTITLTLTTVDGGCGVTTATKTLTITPSPIANPGGTLAEICDGETSAPMGGSIGGSATSGVWTNLNGNGTWTNANNPATATYTAAADDSSLGIITLQLTASGGSCSDVLATKTLTVNPGKTVTPVSTETVCFFTGNVNLTHATTGATGIDSDGVDSANGLPDGVSASFNASTGQISITGNPTELGTFNYSIELLGTCGVAFATGTIEVEDCGCVETFDFDTDPSGTWVVPDGVTELIVEAWGAGGRGGTRTSDGYGAGGGGGGYSRSILSVNPGDSFSYSIGQGGNNSNIDGGNTIFGSNLVVANGGEGASNNSSAGGDGATAGTGDVTYSGGDGANADNFGGGQRSGGGGSSGGQDSDGNGGSGRNGGTAVTGGGAGGDGANGGSNDQAGGDGAQPGGGGGGADRIGSSTVNGGEGGDGRIKLTYTLNAGIVNGPQSICVGGTTTFTSTMMGGVWSSADPAIATVDPSAGVITGVSPGAATIRYTITGCTIATSSRTVFVNAPISPGTISGDQDICIGGDTQLLSSTAFGTWSSDNTSIATVSNTGVVTGVSPGIVDIFYTLPASGGCPAPETSISITVTAPPDAGTLSGTQEVCEGGTRTFSSTTSGGVWSSGNPSVATIDPSTGVITGVSAGSAILTYTVSGSGGCPDDFETRTITVTPAPDAGTLSGTDELCIGETSVFSSTSLGGTWSSSNPAVASINASTGEVTALSNGTTTISYTVTGSGSCTDDVATRTLTINSLPNPSFTAQPTGIVCIGEAVTYSTQAGQFNYDWQISGSAGVDYNIVSGGTMTDNSLTLEWLSQGSKQVFLNYENASGCSAPTAISNTISVSPLPNPTFINQPSGDYCLGEVVTYTTQSGRSNYNWSLSGTQGTDYNITAGGINTNSISVEWLTTGSNTVTVNYENSGGCEGATPASNTININLRPVPTFTAEPNGAICIGQEYTFETQSGAGITDFEWFVSGNEGVDFNVTAGGTNSDNLISLIWLTDGEKTVSVNYLNSDGCPPLAPATSTIDVDPLPVPTFIMEPSNPTCIGDEVTYTTESGQSNYIWTISGVSGTDYNIISGGIGTGSPTVTIEWLTDGDKTVTVGYTNANGCVTAAAASNTITLAPLPVPTFTVEPADPVCIGDEVTYTTESGQFNYTWNIPGSEGTDFTITGGGIGSNSNSVTLQWLTDGSKTVTVNYQDSNGCSGIAPASNTINLDPLPAPSFTAEPSNPVCLNDVVTYTTQAGQTDYSWTVSGSLGTDYNITAGGIGTSSNTVTIEWLTSGTKTVTVNYTDGNGCFVPSPASNTIEVSIFTSIVTQIDNTNLLECFGDGFDPLFVVATGSNLSYQWYRNTTGVIDTSVDTQVGTNSNTYTPPSTPVGSSYYYVVVSGDCGSETSAISGVRIVDPSGTLITDDPDVLDETICFGNSFSQALDVAALGDGGSTVTYQWYQNTTPDNTGGVMLSGETSPTNFTPPSDASVADGLPRYYYATASSSCGTVPTAISGAFIVNPLTSIETENLTGATICDGQGPFSPISVSAIGTGTLSYQWYSNTTGVINTGVDSQVGTDSDTFTPPSNVADGVPVYYYVVVSSSGGCGSDQTSSISGGFVVNPLPTPTFTIAPPSEVCVGTSVTYTTESGQANYVWNVPGVENTDYTITSGGIGNTDETVTLTWLTGGTKDVTVNYSNANNCSATTATINSTIVNALPEPTFTTAPPTEVCVGTSVTYTTESGQTNYVWNVPGTAGSDYNITSGGISGTDNSVTLTWLSAGAKDVSVNYTNADNCAAATATINSTIVNTLPTPTFTTAPPAEVCVGTSVTYTTEAGQSNYDWNIPGTAGTDYSITAGGIGSTSNTVTLTWLSDGTKDVSINYSNSDNCSAATAVVNSTIVNALPNPTFITEPPIEVCVGTSVTYATESGQSNYVWTIPGSAGTDFNITAGGGTTDDTVTLTWLTSGTKDVSVNYTNSNNCSAAAAVVNTTFVNSLPAPTFTTEPTSDVCIGTTVTYTTQPGQDNYAWSVPGVAGTDYTITSGGIGPFDNSVTLTWLSAGTKDVSVNYSNSNNCTAATAISNSIDVDALPVPTFTEAPTSDLCIGTPVTYTTEAGQTNYIWNLPGSAGTDYNITAGGIGSNDNSVTLVWLTEGTKNVSVNYSNANGCTAVSAVSNSTLINVIPVISDITGTTISCGASFTVTPVDGTNGFVPAGTTYTWTVIDNPDVTGEADESNPQTNISQLLTNTSIVDQVVTYTVTPTTPDGCAGNPFDVDVLVRAIPTVDPVPDQNIGCAGPSTTAVNFTGNGVAGVVYNWTNSNPEIGLAAAGSGNIPSFVTQNTTSATIDAEIIVTPTVNGCTGPSESFTISVDPTPEITLQADYCAVDGEVVLVASSAVTGTTFEWSTGETTPSIQVDLAGLYSVTATSPDGCTATASLSVAEELIVDGSFTNFDPANPSFFTEYTQNQAYYVSGDPNTGLWPEGYYAVNINAQGNTTTTPPGYHSAFYGRDHTNNATGDRNFMMVNGGELIGTPLRQPVIWRQTVPVEQFTEYYFSAWAMNLNPASNARLQFKINGQLVGTVLDLSSAPEPTSDAEVGLDNWREFRSDPSWSSGTATTAVIEIVNLNTTLGGNDFGLDDISFGTLSPFIRLTSDPGTDDSQVVCQDSPIIDITYDVGGGLSGPVVTNLPPGVTAIWNGVNLRITGSPTTPGDYTYEVFTTGSCQQVRVEGLIVVRDVPDEGTIASDQTVCLGDTPATITGSVYTPQDAGAVISYRWEMNTDLTTPNWVDVPGNPSGADYDPPVLTEATQYRRYTISTVGTNSCEGPATDPVTITIQTEPIAGTIAADQSICPGDDPAAFISTESGAGDGNISYIWQFRNSTTNPLWTTISGATGETYDSPALTETTEFQRITVSTLNGVDCESDPTPAVTVTILPENTVTPVNPDPPLCFDTPQPVTIIHNSTGATGIENAGVEGANGLPLGISASFNSTTGDITISGTPAEVGTFNYSIPLTGGCGDLNATGTITVDNPTYPIISIDVQDPPQGSSPPYTSTFTVFSNELAPGDYEINYSITGTNAGSDQTISVTVTTAGQFTFDSPPYTNGGTSVLTINSIREITDLCPYTPPNNNTAEFGASCSTEFLESDGNATYSVLAGVSEITIEVFGNGTGGNTASQTMNVTPGGQIFLVYDASDNIYATELPDTEPDADRLAQAIVSVTGPDGRFLITYECPDDPSCTDSGAVTQYTDSEGYTVIRFTGECQWTVPEGLDEFEVLVVGGGGGGGFGDAAGGGGGGGVFYQNYTGITMNGNPGLQGAVFQVSPGGQGIGSTNPNQQGGDGEGSSFTGPSFDYAGGNTFSNISVAGGGGGGSSSSSPTSRAGRDGASGGGGAAFGGDTSGGGIASPDGNEGGAAFAQGSSASGAGGGGATTGGGDGSGDASLVSAGNGGNGFIQGISGEDLFYGAGGGGTSSGATVNEPGLGGSPYSDGASQFYAGGRGNNTGVGLPATTYGSGGGAGRTGGSNGFQGVVYIRYPNFRILPVEFLYFEAEHNEALRSGDLTWATAQEWENDRFEIQRSLNAAKDWEIIGEVEGAGYSDQVQMYDFRDLNLPPAGGDIFYRLKQYDEDGDFTYSETRAIQVEPLPGITRWRVYPNPTTGDPINFALLEPSLYEDEEITLRIISPTGDYVIIEVDDMTTMGAQVTQYFRNLAAGVYTIEISWGEQIEYHKVILKR